MSLYEAVGGEAFFRRLVDVFYEGVAADEVLAPLYPEAPDFAAANERLRLFLVQFWGGPTTYSDQRGHPRLRMRHLPFRIGPEERDRWLLHMNRAVDVATSELPHPVIASAVAEALRGYFTPSAEAMRNDTGLPISSPRSG